MFKHKRLCRVIHPTLADLLILSPTSTCATSYLISGVGHKLCCHSSAANIIPDVPVCSRNLAHRQAAYTHHQREFIGRVGGGQTEAADQLIHGHQFV